MLFSFTSGSVPSSNGVAALWDAVGFLDNFYVQFPKETKLLISQNETRSALTDFALGVSWQSGFFSKGERKIMMDRLTEYFQLPPHTVFE